LDRPDSLTENLVRYRTAALVCFGIAIALYTAVALLPLGPMRSESVAALGVAWWLVGCGLVPLTCYWAWRRAQEE
jgi:hypothetical protein